MNRKGIRDYLLILADEFDVEEDEGLFNNETVNTLIDVSQNVVQLDIGKLVPKKFRKTVLINITANKREYSIVSDLSITDFHAFHSILHNVTGKRGTPLIEIDSEEEWRWEDTDELTYWGYEDKDQIFVGTNPTSTVAERLKGYYFPLLADITSDNASPAMPIVCHPLIAIDVLKKFAIADEANLGRIQLYYQDQLSIIAEGLSMKSVFRDSGPKPSAVEVITSRDA